MQLILDVDILIFFIILTLPPPPPPPRKLGPFQVSLKDSPSYCNKVLHNGNGSNNFQILYRSSRTNSI